MKVGVIFPSGEMVHADFAKCLAALSYFSSDLNLTFIHPKGCYVDDNRNNGVSAALEQGVDYVLFIDTDMTFPPDSLNRLLSAGKDVVAASYAQRVAPHHAMLIFMEGGRQEENLIEVNGAPTGLMLVKKEVFERIGECPFRTPYVEKDGKLKKQSEDYYFCGEAIKAGFEVWVDMALSLEVGHIGQQVHRIELHKGSDAVVG